MSHPDGVVLIETTYPLLMLYSCVGWDLHVDEKHHQHFHHLEFSPDIITAVRLHMIYLVCMRVCVCVCLCVCIVRVVRMHVAYICKCERALIKHLFLPVCMFE